MVGQLGFTDPRQQERRRKLCQEGRKVPEVPHAVEILRRFQYKNEL